jgi:hypothetical protein
LTAIRVIARVATIRLRLAFRMFTAADACLRRVECRNHLTQRLHLAFAALQSP